MPADPCTRTQNGDKSQSDHARRALRACAVQEKTSRHGQHWLQRRSDYLQYSPCYKYHACCSPSGNIQSWSARGVHGRICLCSYIYSEAAYDAALALSAATAPAVSAAPAGAAVVALGAVKPELIGVTASAVVLVWTPCGPVRVRTYRPVRNRYRPPVRTESIPHGFGPRTYARPYGARTAPYGLHCVRGETRTDPVLTTCPYGFHSIRSPHGVCRRQWFLGVLYPSQLCARSVLVYTH